MHNRLSIVRTRLAPPRPSKHTLSRSRLTERLLEAARHRVTIVQAGTGYGKSTAAAELVQTGVNCVWYHLSDEDADVLVFLSHLLYGLHTVVPELSQTAVGELEKWPRQKQAERAFKVVDLIINELDQKLTDPLYFIIDDAQHLNTTAATRDLLGYLIHHAPHRFHPILLTRYPLDFSGLLEWRMRGEILEINQQELAFTAVEITDLFAGQYGLTLEEEDVLLLTRRVEGWPIALPLVWQRFYRDRSIPNALGRVSGTTGDLFAWLVQEVIAQQPPAVQRFLQITSVLREMTVDRCNALREASDSDQILATLHDRGLFVVDLGSDRCRYHHLFRDLLINQLSPGEAQTAHRRAAVIAANRKELEEAIYHHLEAHDFAAAAVVLTHLGRKLVRSGRLDTLSDWLAALPPDILADHPNLLTYMGDIARLYSRFEEALGWYEQALDRARQQNDRQSIGQALRGQARVYLDTVNPSRAEELLQEALRLADGIEDRQSQARLLTLMAENLLNRGRLKEAEVYQQQARQLQEEGPSEVEVPVRLLLRTGRLDEALEILDRQAAQEEKEPVLVPRAHRETMLLLSLIHAFKGEQAAAYRFARLGTERGQRLKSEFITAVGWMRQGHAHLLAKNQQGYEQARHCFQKAIRLSETLLVPRLKVEAYWGLTQAYGFQGDLVSAQEMTEAGLELAREAGDEWIAAALHLAWGASLVLSGVDESAELAKALNGFEECGDHYGMTVTLLWQSLLWRRLGDRVRLERDLKVWLRQIRQHNYGFICRRPILLGPPDPRSVIPLLVAARNAEIEAPLTQDLLQQIGVSPLLEIHPGYQLRVNMLGPFRLWLGREEVPASAWKRQKARQLFQLLLTRRETLLDREQIIDLLWPELDPLSGERDFKIAYTTLLKVLEPQRDRKAPSAFVMRDGSRYGLRPEADIAVDILQFERLAAAGDQQRRVNPDGAIEHYRAAVELYQGDFLQAFPYERWASEERERLLTIYMRTAERLAQLLAHQERWEGVVYVAEQILQRDDCWEEAYRLLMRAYAALGQRPLALRVYQRCAERLQAELNVAPAGVTLNLLEEIKEREV
ncbi:MAG: BTAD domain-containing putative transcriptional regulator [Ardenticatenaceae bacterium]|nr:BTAD domain-containing putative transcriptional regulator [Ardenticatenaceae bacterium]